MDRSLELENLRRSLAMLRPGANASLSREEAMRLIAEVADLEARLKRVRLGLRQTARRRRGLKLWRTRTGGI